MPFFGCPAEDRGWGSHAKDASWRLLAIIWRGAMTLAAPAFKVFLLTKDEMSSNWGMLFHRKVRQGRGWAFAFSIHRGWPEHVSGYFFSACLQVGSHWQPSLKFEKTFHPSSYACDRRRWKHHKTSFKKKHILCVYKIDRNVNATSHLVHLSTRLFVAPSWRTLESSEV